MDNRGNNQALGAFLLENEGRVGNEGQVRVPGIPALVGLHDAGRFAKISPPLAFLTMVLKNTPYLLTAGFALAIMISFADNAIVAAPLSEQKNQDGQDHAANDLGYTDSTAIINYGLLVAWAYYEKTMAGFPMGALYMSAYIALAVASAEVCRKFFGAIILSRLGDIRLSDPLTLEEREEFEANEPQSKPRFVYDYYAVTRTPSAWFLLVHGAQNNEQNQQEKDKNNRLLGSYLMACAVIAFALTCVQLGFAQRDKANNYIDNQEKAFADMLAPTSGALCGEEGTMPYKACLANSERIGINKATSNYEKIFDLTTQATIWAAYLAITMIVLPLAYWTMSYFMGLKAPFKAFSHAEFADISKKIASDSKLRQSLKDRMSRLNTAPSQGNEQPYKKAIFSETEISAIITSLTVKHYDQGKIDKLKLFVAKLDFTSFLNGIVWEIIGSLPLYTAVAFTAQEYLTGVLALPPERGLYEDNNDDFYDYAVALKPDGLSKNPADAQDYADMQSSTVVTADILENNTLASGVVALSLMSAGLIHMSMRAAFLYSFASKGVINLTAYKDDSAKARYLRENPDVEELAKNLGRSVFIGGYVDLYLVTATLSGNDGLDRFDVAIARGEYERIVEADRVYKCYVAFQASLQTKLAPWLPSASDVTGSAMISFTVVMFAVLFYTALGTQDVSKKFWDAFHEKYDSQKSPEAIFNMMCLLVEQAHAHIKPIQDAFLTKLENKYVTNGAAADPLDMTTYAVQLAVAAGMSGYMDTAQFQGNAFFWFIIGAFAIGLTYPFVAASITAYCRRPADEVRAAQTSQEVHNAGFFQRATGQGQEEFGAVSQSNYDSEEGDQEVGLLGGQRRRSCLDRCAIM